MKTILIMILSLASITLNAQSIEHELDSLIHAYCLESLVMRTLNNNKNIDKLEAETRVIRAVDFKFKSTARFIAVKKNCKDKIYCDLIRHPKTGETILVGGPNAFDTSILDYKTPGEVRILKELANPPSKEWVDKKIEDILDGWILP